ncbi:MAG: CHC2 zinc finger domain-containing protein [Polyangiaceae bacterium]
MARVSEAEIQRLKREISVERLAEARGVKLKKHGKDLIGLCPFHDDREPSLVITPEKNLWHCLGACQAGGSAIDWVMKAEGASFRYAVELLRAGLPSLAAEPPAKRPPPKLGSVRKLPVVGARSADNAALLLDVVGYYHQTLLESAEALEYLGERGIRNEEAMKHFRLGFANRTLGYRLPAKNRHQGAELRGRLVELGVYRESGHEHLNGSLTIPIFDESGAVAGMYGRKINQKLRGGTPLHLYLPGPHRGVWNWEALRDSKEIILCESLIDALTFWCAGFRNVTAAYGVEGFTGDHRRAFSKWGTERVLIAFDRDEAGDRAADKLAEELEENGIASARVLFPKGMDANEYALKVTPADKSLGLALRQAEWRGSGKPAVIVESVEPPPATEALPTAAELAQGDAGDVAELDEAEAGAVSDEQSEPEGAERGTTLDPPRSDLSESEHLPSLAAELPAAPEPEVAGDDLVFHFGDRRWRIRGFSKNTGPGELRVNLHVSRPGGAFHVDTVELYSARQRAVFTKQASDELGLEERVVKRELGAVLLKLEERQEAEKKAAAGEKARPEITDVERQDALELLRDPQLFERLLADFRRCGVVGEETNKLVGYLAATSRKLDEPLAVILQSSSAAGKSSLMEAVLALMPEEERVQYSAMTGQSLFYMGESDLAHKILAIVEEEGAERASYALKLLQSEGELTIASTGKDPATGRLVTQEYRVEGPVMIFLTTTAIEVDEELLNRCIVLTVDEGREQTRAIHELQREAQTLEGLLAKHDRSRIRKLHQNAQRLLRPLAVVNPHARELRFLDHQTRTRRDHTKYLGLIRAIALLHQYQRPVREVEHRGEKIRYIEASREDIALANRLAQEVLGRSLDELPPQTRRLLELTDELVASETKRLGLDRCDYRFSRRQVREHTRWGNTQLRVHLERLVEMEYLLVHRGGRGQGFSYELLFDGRAVAADRFIAGLVDVDEPAAAASTTPTWRGSGAELAGGWRGENGPETGRLRGGGGATNQHQLGSKPSLTVVIDSETHIRSDEKSESYVPARRSRSSLAARAAR